MRDILMNILKRFYCVVLCMSFNASAMEKAEGQIAKNEDLSFGNACRIIVCYSASTLPLYKTKQRDKETLDLSDRGIYDAEKYIKQMATACMLNKSIENPTIDQLKYFTVNNLQLQKNDLKKLPDLSELSQELGLLNVSHNKLEELSVIAKLTKLTDLNIADCGVKEIKKELTELTALTRLTVSETDQFQPKSLPFKNCSESSGSVDWNNACGYGKYITYIKK